MNALCTCIADDATDYISAYGIDLYTMMLYQKSSLYLEEPLQAILEASEYRREFRDLSRSCTQTYQPVWEVEE